MGARLDEAGVGIAIHDAVVTLTGHVASYSERFAAERGAKRVAGVTAIANDLVVKPPSSMDRDDTRLAEAAVQALRWHSDVPAAAPTVGFRLCSAETYQ
jgi:hypothetical protein